MGFADYLYQLATRVFKRSSPNKVNDMMIYSQAIGPQYDDALATLFEIREQSMLATSSGRALDMHGLDRSILRYPGETDEIYRLRLLAAYSTYQQMGTKQALISVLQRLGYVTDVEEIYLTDPERWAEFNVLFYIDGESALTSLDSYILQDIVRTMKPAHTRMAELLVEISPVGNINIFDHRLAIIHQGSVDFWNGRLRRWDGSWRFDGSEVFSDIRYGPHDGHIIWHISLPNTMLQALSQIIAGEVCNLNMVDAVDIHTAEVQENNKMTIPELKLHQVHQADHEVGAQSITTFDPWFWDGTFNFDGTKLFDAIYLVEEL